VLAVDLAVSVAASQGTVLTTAIAAGFLAISMVFVYRSFYRMRIQS
jgi:K(+)-stimulated pyrophosphate-energized sodium pump